MSESRPLPGIIFDIDGVLLDSNPAHLESWKVMAGEEGFDFSDSLFQQTFGQTTVAILTHHWNRRLSEEEIVRMARRKEEIYREMAARKLPAMPGAAEFVRSLHAAGFPISVGSSGPGYNVDFVLDRLGVVPFLNGIVSGTDVTRGKPAPDIFLGCAEKMGVDPRNCVAIDDSKSGVQAARAAGMKIIGFFSAGHKDDEYDDVDLLIRSFDELSPEILLGLFAAK